MDVVFAVDSSGSIRETRFKYVRAFMTRMLSLLDVDSGNIRAGLIQFSDDVTRVFHMDEYDERWVPSTPETVAHCCCTAGPESQTLVRHSSSIA